MTRINFSALDGRQVISIAEGTKVGNVRDALLDTATHFVAGFVVGGDRGEVVLPFGKIAKIGPDAIMIEGASATQSGGADGLRKLSDLQKLDVMSSEGTALGNVGDLELDQDSGQILSLDVRAGGVFGLGAQKQTVTIGLVRSFGTDAITVDKG
jgi:sporulation protein YlmC with PRC-barrel domain